MLLLVRNVPIVPSGCGKWKQIYFLTHSNLYKKINIANIRTVIYISKLMIKIYNIIIKTFPLRNFISFFIIGSS